MDRNNLYDKTVENGRLSMISTEEMTRECLICLKDKFVDEFEGIYGDSCVHIERSVCNSCIYENTKCLVEDSMIYFNDITCPEVNCHQIFDYQGIRQILVFIGKIINYSKNMINI